jgi:glutamyl-tRNA synthetase
MDMSKLWAMNKALIDPLVARYTAVSKEGAVLVRLAGGPKEMEGLTRPKHKKNAELGNKVVQTFHEIYIEQEDAKIATSGEEVTLMDWGNCIFNTVHTGPDGTITHIDATLNLAGNFKLTKRKLTWLPHLPEALVPVKLLEYDHLITKPSLGENDKFEDFINPTTVHETICLGDPNLRLLQKGESIQLERRGYFICEKPLFKTDEILLIAIPDGAQSGPSILSHKVQLKTK